MRCGDHSCNQGREAKMMVVKRDRHGDPIVWCDPCIAQLVLALNEAALVTTASCCGHGRIPGTVALADGRWLVIAETTEDMDKMVKAVAEEKTINDD